MNTSAATPAAPLAPAAPPSRLRGVAITGGSALVSLVAFSLLFSWTFSALVLLQLLVHELGHAFEARRQGIRTTAPLFIPFLGAVIGLKDEPAHAVAEARVAIAGPVAGIVAALATLGVYGATGDHVWLAAAHAGFLINYFNMVPMSPFDGGRIVAAVNPIFWIVGMALFAGAVVWGHYYLLLPFVVLGFADTIRRFRELKAKRDYYDVGTTKRVIWSALYLGLAFALMAGTVLTATPLAGA